MKKFIIYTYDYSPAVGGIKVMHKLCDLLNSNGYESYLMPIHVRDEFLVSADYNTPLVTNEILENLDDCIVIYPEGTSYNPLNAKNVVRWILHYPQRDEKTYGNSDLIYYINQYYYSEYLGHRDNILYVAEFHDDIFKNAGYSRKGSCYSIRKANDPMLVHPTDSIPISFQDAGNLVWLANLFNKSEKFYCYDNHTFLYTQAAMCGCISIVVPQPGMNKDTWMSGSRLHPYGVAWGESDIPRALETLPKLYEEINLVKKEIIEGIIKFANHCNQYFK